MPDNPEPRFTFQGFQNPNTTPVPDEFFDQLLHRLTGAEVKIASYIIRRTFGFKKRSDTISLSQMTQGITTIDGRVLDHGPGLSKATVVRAVKQLVKITVIVKNRNARWNSQQKCSA